MMTLVKEFRSVVKSVKVEKKHKKYIPLEQGGGKLGFTGIVTTL